MNTNFYTIEISSAAYDQRFVNQIAEAQLAETARSGRSPLLSKILQLFVNVL